ncbi:TRAFAC clade GTPase domain-containing protein [Mucilaginibacter lappiensis]|uniref:Double-GTPase 2 domain-containing protein n=1 Tax=Mucilaginibacter lappiensis TaxID=354630 RepID=A0A841JPB1_9SPHI|nr:hypothetical protein [Mucilaginibacter lappiensis]MBB6130588.1 hypothetical protein [Mucilaginibacter lappiensis]
MAKCSNNDCAAHKTLMCHNGDPDYQKCPHWLATNNPKGRNDTKTPKAFKKALNWTGDPLSFEEINSVVGRNSAFTIGIAGRAGAGKTTFLAMVFTLLQKGYGFDGLDFAGSETLIGWDYLYDRLKVYQTQVSFPDPTPLEYCRFFHLALRDEKEVLKDVLISDASGEVFTIWATDRDHVNAGNARLIYQTSSAFILFIDCNDLIARKGRAKADIIKIAEMLKYNLRDRPVIAVWSKSDKKSEVHESILSSLEEELLMMFNNFHQLDISNFSSSQPDPLVHANNLKVIDWLLKQIPRPIELLSATVPHSEKDHFLNFKSHE